MAVRGSCVTTSDSIHACRRPVGETVMTGATFGNSGGRLTRSEMEEEDVQGISYIWPSTMTVTLGLCA